MIPLAYKLRPQKLDDIIGQSHLVSKNGIIRKIVEKKKLVSMIFYGKPGIGKTSLAISIVNELNINYNIFNASSDAKALLKDYLDKSQNYSPYCLIIDEIHRMRKDIQDYLLEYIESGKIIIIGLTTLNPYHAVNPAIRSRTLIFKLNEFSKEELKLILQRALTALDKSLVITSEAEDFIISATGGDVRYLINSLEGISLIINNKTITLDDAKKIINLAYLNYSKNEDDYYDTLSGLQKSIRGSDVNASLHYLAKLIIAEDLQSLIRRLYVIAYEDIGLANPNIASKLKTAADIALEVGLPEARIPLSVIVIEMALSSKSNSAYLAIERALNDIKEGKTGPIPAHLKNTYAFDNNKEKYLYPHDYPNSWVNQQYLPDIIKDANYYEAKDNSRYEAALKEIDEAIKNRKK